MRQRPRQSVDSETTCIAMGLFWLVIAWCWHVVRANTGGQSTLVKKCLKEYYHKIEGFDLCPRYLGNLRDQVERNEKVQAVDTSTRVILDLGLGSLGHYSEVFQHMVHLNISGFDGT